jgi:PAS domain S-box-containing protein
MDQVEQFQRESFPKPGPPPGGRIASIVLAAASVVLLASSLVVNVQNSRLSLLVLIAFVAAIVSLVFLLTGFSRQLHRDQRATVTALQTTEQEFQEMAGNIQEIFWMIDAQTKKAIFVTPAYESITGRSCQSLMENPSSYEEVIHPDDRVHALARLDEAATTGSFDERFRIVKPTGEIRWFGCADLPAEKPTARSPA